MKIGLLCGREYSFPPAFIERVNQILRPFEFFRRGFRIVSFRSPV